MQPLVLSSSLPGPPPLKMASSLLDLNHLHVPVAPEFTFPAQISLLKCRLVYPTSISYPLSLPGWVNNNVLANLLCNNNPNSLGKPTV